MNIFEYVIHYLETFVSRKINHIYFQLMLKLSQGRVKFMVMLQHSIIVSHEKYTVVYI